ncbi:MAG: hypothetical protein MUF10_16235, partial [Thermoanaerobaculaceae bacterium]|nr:hypothetical protein [Thermoanaerobaculaceae bacterium]
MSEEDIQTGCDGEVLALRARVRELEEALARVGGGAGVAGQVLHHEELVAQESEQLLRRVIDLIPHIVFAKD